MPHPSEQGYASVWPVVGEWVGAARNRVEVLPVDEVTGRDELARLGITEHSVLGALARHSGGLLVELGWLRVLGGGSPRLGGSLSSWNGLGPMGRNGPRPCGMPGALLVGYDVIGGFYALDGGGLGGGRGEVHYLAPDTLAWEGLGLDHRHWVQWALEADLGAFADFLRWESWESDVKELGEGEVFQQWPPPWSVQGKDPRALRRRTVTISDAWDTAQSYRVQLGFED